MRSATKNLKKKERQIEEQVERLEHTNVGASRPVQEVLEQYGSTPLKKWNYTGRVNPPSGIIL